MTERLYYHDAYLQTFQARVIEAADGGRRVYLDRTAFYPTSGGQPYDLGTLGGITVVEVVDEEDRVSHVLDAALPPDRVSTGDIEGQVDWARRFDHMQQHTGQHLLSAVLADLFDIPTLSFHLGDAASTIEVGAASLEAKRIEKAEERCAEIVREARPVVMTFEDSSADLGLRKASERTGTLRIISIDGVDRSACGGTHVRNTAEIGPVLIRKLDKVRGNVRLEFVCGLRALRQARADFRTLTDISRSLSVPIEKTPTVAAGLVEKIKTAEKQSERLSTELAHHEGKELYASTVPRADGIRFHTERGPIDDVLRARARAFTSGGKAVFLAVCENPPSVLLAASPDSGIDAGARVKAAVTAAGGRGGGNPSLAQGSVPDGSHLEQVVNSIFPVASL